MKLFLHELRAQQRLFWRSRELAFFTFLLPLILFVLLGSVNQDGEIEGVRGSDYLLAGMVGYGAASTAFAGLAILLINRRESGVLKRVRGTPLPAATYLAAVLTSILLVFVIETILLVVLAVTMFDAHVPDRLGSTAVLVVGGAAAFAALGIAVASLIRNADAAAAAVNGIYLPMAFLSGSFFSPEAFPGFLQAIGNVLPLTYYIDVVRDVMVEDRAVWDEPRELAIVAAWGIGALVVALRTFSWEPKER